MSILPRTTTHGCPDSVPSQAKLPAVANEGAICRTEDLGGVFVYDATAKAWKPLAVLPFVYDFSVHGGAVGDIALGATVPANSIIVAGTLDIVGNMAFTPSTATIALKVVSAADLLAATDVGNANGRSTHASTSRRPGKV